MAGFTGSKMKPGDLVRIHESIQDDGGRLGLVLELGRGDRVIVLLDGRRRHMFRGNLIVVSQ